MAEKVYKAKMPIQQDGNYYYPITSYDQIVMPDGNRWDGVSGGDVDLDNLATREYVDQEIAKVAVKYFTNEDIDEVTGGCPIPNYKTYTLRIDENNSNPLTACEYMDDAVGMEKGSSAWDTMPIFNDIKPCVFKDGEVVYYLDPNNFALKADGSAAVLDGTDGDVMIEFKKFAYRLYKENGYQYVSITNDPDLVASDNRFQYYAFSRDTVGDVDKMYIGAFKGYMDADGKLRSIVNGEKATQVTANEVKNAINLAEENYNFVTFGQLTALQCLFLIKYGTLDAKVLGQPVVSKEYPVIGNTIDKGMYYGSPEQDNDIYPIKFAGMEAIFDSGYEWCDNIKFLINLDDQTFNHVVYYGDQEKKYIMIDVPQGYKSTVIGITDFGFITETAEGSLSTYYSVYEEYFPMPYDKMVYYGETINSMVVGLFRLESYYAENEKDWLSPFARLTYV